VLKTEDVKSAMKRILKGQGSGDGLGSNSNIKSCASSTMSKLSEAKTLGGVGAILTILLVIPVLGWILAIVGVVLLLVAVKYISDTVGDAAIFRNMIVAVVLAVVGLILGVAVILGSVLSYVGLSSLSGLTAIKSVTPSTPGVMGLVAGVILGLVALWVLLVVSAVFSRRAYDSMAGALGVGMFRTAGLLYLIGAATAIIFVGFIIVFVAIILNIVAFFSIPDQPAQMPAGPAPSVQPPPPAVTA